MKRIFSLVMITLLLLSTACSFDANDEPIGVLIPESTGTTSEKANETASKTPVPESSPSPASKTTAACFYVKSNELYFTDSVLRTPIRLSQNMLSEWSHDADSVLSFARNQLIAKYYEGQGRFVLFSDNAGQDLYYRDVSAANGNNVLIAENASPGFQSTYMVPEKSVVYYLSGLHADLYEFSMSTGELSNVDTMIADISLSKEADITYTCVEGDQSLRYFKNAGEEKRLSPDSDYAPSSRDILASFADSQWYMWTAAEGGKDVYYQNGSSKQKVCHVDESIFRKDYLVSPVLNKPVFLFSYRMYKVFLLIGADSYEISFGSDASISKISLDKQGKRAYVMVEDSENCALYCIDLEKQAYTTPILLADHLKIYNIDSEGRVYCITTANELTSNGVILDSGDDLHFLGGAGDMLLYTTNDISGDYTLKYVKALKTVFVADHVHDHIQRKEQIFWLGDYDSDTSTGNLYLFDETGNHLMDTDVMCFIGYQSSTVS